MRCTSRNRLSLRDASACSMPSTCVAIDVPPCTANPLGLLIASQPRPSARNISSNCCCRLELATIFGDPGDFFSATGCRSGGSRTICPANRRLLAFALPPSTRISPLRSIRSIEPCANPGTSRRKNRSRRLSSSSSGTVSKRHCTVFFSTEPVIHQPKVICVTGLSLPQTNLFDQSETAKHAFVDATHHVDGSPPCLAARNRSQ